MLRTTLLFLLLVTVPTRANLGETVQQCVVRYGKPAHFTEATPKAPFGTMIFTAAGYGLVVFLSGTTEVGARVSKLDNSAFSETDLKTIMSADSDGTPWTSISSDDPTCLRWTRGDRAIALYDQEKHVLIFTSEQMSKDLQALKDKTPASTNAPTATPPAAK